MKKDPTFKKVMETQNEIKDSEGFDWLESTELAIDKRKFLLNRLYEKQPIPLVSLPAVFLDVTQRSPSLFWGSVA